ncbi:alkaline phosphatase synthesis sensor protein PhoR [Clostridium saccharobutylicum]|uniref:sensor histidine kinase n=1 Tax=Clostridium saccharobutylicum TaxID=169679 RepID=UPI0009839A7C|nr:HAMP domain-containing sensor histidine kinase [Clostridium saccharobutylicum]AQS11363.1 alkaline phosphatase synthesis sensor protein PhoR [Clostridium saccharobutylicum]MBC2437986.1 HAMP domain-containing histidine kinase [Clostridium saccharobutylicum]NSB88760.1 signal transduction histidine kinase [Clostridium saccharobutylicum]NYC30662.1 signal transduction histidine kinase [Clostridium saccharobutylicum]OOM16982.1 alkaline phosphatase synthesis sensor protein PhoR [Clostridium sacchar
MNKLIGKLWGFIILNIIIIFAISWIFQVVFFDKYYVYQRTKIMQEELNEVSLMIQNSISSDDILNEIIDFGSASNCLVIVTDENFNINYTSATQIKNNNSIILENVKYIKTQIQPQTQKTVTSFKTQGTRFTSIVMGNSVNDAQKGYVIIQSFMEPINETTSVLKKQLMIVCLFSLLIGSCIAFILANKFSKPILEINEASKRIAEGDFDTVVSVKSKDEVAILAQTINHMSKQLKQKDNIKKQFIANISHELKTPLSSIRAYGELLLDCDIVDNNEKDKYAEIIIMNSKKLNNMVEDILELSEIQSGNYILESSSFCLIALIEDVLNDINALAAEKNVQITLETFNDTLLITADKDKIHSVFCNILQNAIRHSNLNGIVEIKLTNIDSNLYICIIDNGDGIPKDKLPYIWDRFYKVDKSRKSEKSGAGLGMAIVKEILKLHNYTYGIESQVGIGTQVWFDITE